MPHLQTEQIILHKRPTGELVESDFCLEKTKLASSLQSNELRLHGRYYSVDPYMRGRMNEKASILPAFGLNEPLAGGVIARVVESRSSKFQKGDLVFGQLPWSTDMITQDSTVKLVNTDVAPASEYLGILGLTGLTAYFGMIKIGQPQKGDTVVISGAAGAVGTVAGQIAKIFECRVIGIVGSDSKAEYLMHHYGFDGAINYHHRDQMLSLRELCPNGVDVYFDNVGGEISKEVLTFMNFEGRVVLCGQISLYDQSTTPEEPRMLPYLVNRSVHMQSFLVSEFENEYTAAIEQLSTWLDAGKLESTETIIDGFEKLPQALCGLFAGKNLGKMIVRAAL